MEREKRGKMKYKFLTFILIIASTSAFAGGWVPKKGHGYFKLGQSALRSNSFIEQDGTESQIITTSVYFTSFYGEYGFTDRLTGVVYAPFFSRMTVNAVEFTSGLTQSGDDFNGWGDSDLGLKYGFLQGGNFVMNASLTLGLPIGGTAGGNSEALQLGDGEFNQLVRVEAGFAPSKTNLYFNAGAGFNNRTQGFSEEFRYNFEAGYSKGKFVGAMKLDGIKSLKNGEPTGTANGIFSNNMELLTFTPEVAIQLKEKMGITANTSLILYGRRILNAPSYSAGIYWKF